MKSSNTTTIKSKAHAAVGAALRGMRQSQSRTYAEVAEAMGMSKCTVVNLETGRQEILFSNVTRMANAYWVTPNFICNVFASALNPKNKGIK